MPKTIFLASKSPRRRELLALTGLTFSIFETNEVDEEDVISKYIGETEKASEFMAVEKANNVLKSGVDGIFITADTIVVDESKSILGKPADEEEAAKFLRILSGKWHMVSTGVAIVDSADKKIHSINETTLVKFGPMTDEEISSYIATGEPFDKAGGYGIQGRASIYIEKIDGCYFNVVGFPLYAFWNLWKKIYNH
jgi:septum formation protein